MSPSAINLSGIWNGGPGFRHRPVETVQKIQIRILRLDHPASDQGSHRCKLRVLVGKRIHAGYISGRRNRQTRKHTVMILSEGLDAVCMLCAPAITFVSLALIFSFITFGTARAISMPITVITTRSSTRVNPFCRFICSTSNIWRDRSVSICRTIEALALCYVIVKLFMFPAVIYYCRYGSPLLLNAHVSASNPVPTHRAGLWSLPDRLGPPEFDWSIFSGPHTVSLSRSNRIVVEKLLQTHPSRPARMFPSARLPAFRRCLCRYAVSRPDRSDKTP